MENKADTQNKIFLRTYGWPKVQVTHDDFEGFKDTK